MSKYQDITISIPVSNLKLLARIAVETALSDYTDTELDHAGVDYDSLCKRLFKSLDWEQELAEGLVDHFQDQMDRFAEAVVDREHKLLVEAVEKCERAVEELEA